MVAAEENIIEDNMDAFLWDGPEDSDEEIEELAKYKTEWEKEAGIKFSKRGIMEAIHKAIAQESPNNTEDPKTAKAWERKNQTPGLTYYLKKGGSQISKTQPFFRSEVTFNRAVKFDKMVKCIYSPEH